MDARAPLRLPDHSGRARASQSRPAARGAQLAFAALLALAFATSPASAVAQAAGGPRLVNEVDVLEPLMFTMMRTGLVADGTAFAEVRLAPDGAATVRALLGVVTANPQLAQLVREATARARFHVPSEWSSANPRAGWAVFWAFQTNGCGPWAYDAPAGATVIRVCLDVVDGKVNPASSSYLVDADPAPYVPRGPEPRYRNSRGNPYPNAAREQGAQGYVTMRVRLDERGRVAAADVREDTAGSLFGAWLERWRNDAEFDVPAGWPGPGRPRTLDMRIAFAIAPRYGSECPWVLRKFDGIDHRICASPISSRP